MNLWGTRSASLEALQNELSTVSGYIDESFSALPGFVWVASVHDCFIAEVG